MENQTVIEGWRGIAVSCGLASPFSRAVTAAVLTGVASYALKYPSGAFRKNGDMRPHSSLSMEQGATSNHFILMPLAVGTGVFLFT